MSSDVVLTSALRTNLQSLQNTQRLIDETQLKLATGLAINSALDNPQNFFAAQSLNNRAGDLSRLLDGIGQSVRTIEQADNGIESLTSLVEQAESVATSALEATGTASSSTSITGNLDVSDFELDASYDNAELTLTATSSAGQTLAFDGGTNPIVLTTGNTEQDIINGINALTIDGEQAFQASLTESGRLNIETLSDINFSIGIDGDGSADSALSQSLSSELGFGSIGRLQDPTAATSEVTITSKSAAVISSGALYSDSTGDTVAQRSDTLDSLSRDTSTASTYSDTDVFGITASDTPGGETYVIQVGVNGVARQDIAVTATTTVQGLVDSINDNSVLNTQIRAGFNDETGQITFTSLTSEVESVELGTSVTDTGTDISAAISINLGFGVNGAQSATKADTTANAVTESSLESIRVSGGAGEIAQLEDDFNTVLAQIDTLVADSDYRGTNLLNGDNLTTTFDEDRENTLTTEGVDFTSTGLGIDGGTFADSSAISDALTQTRDALTSVRDFGQSIANDLAIIETRRDFTESTINTLEAGADDLTVADQNEEGANLLALQTRQQLGVTSLSLASQSQQAVLRLF